jgi:hypothetical protein
VDRDLPAFAAKGFACPSGGRGFGGAGPGAVKFHPANKTIGPAGTG